MELEDIQVFEQCRIAATAARHHQPAAEIHPKSLQDPGHRGRAAAVHSEHDDAVGNGFVIWLARHRLLGGSDRIHRLFGRGDAQTLKK